MRGLRRTVRTEGEISIGELASGVIRLCDVCALCDTRNERDACGARLRRMWAAARQLRLAAASEDWWGWRDSNSRQPV
jgi:hypothetical protein